jgi:hypothetical protein
MLTVKNLLALEVKASDGAHIVSVGANLCLYIENPLNEIADGVMSVFEEFLEICPPEKMSWYLTNSMEKHERVTQRTLGIPKLWLRSEKRSKQLMSYEIKDSVSKHHSDTANWKFGFVSRSRDNKLFAKRANMIEVLFSCEYANDHVKAFLGFVENACNQLPFLSGHAGYTLEVSKYYENKGAYDKALAIGMRYRELDISEPEFALAVKKHNGIKGVNWLTILGRDFSDQIAASERKDKRELAFKEVTGGLIVQAGDRPAVADGNRGEGIAAYRESYDLLRRFIVSTPFPLRLTVPFEERMEKTREWIHRFARK